jgi:hypothetical protein
VHNHFLLLSANAANDPTDDAVPLPTAAANVLAEPAAAAGMLSDI